MNSKPVSFNILSRDVAIPRRFSLPLDYFEWHLHYHLLVLPEARTPCLYSAFKDEDLALRI